jgi:hypothetical protein
MVKELRPSFKPFFDIYDRFNSSDFEDIIVKLIDLRTQIIKTIPPS